jgi:hypothetical protein
MERCTLPEYMYISTSLKNFSVIRELFLKTLNISTSLKSRYMYSVIWYFFRQISNYTSRQTSYYNQTTRRHLSALNQCVYLTTRCNSGTSLFSYQFWPPKKPKLYLIIPPTPRTPPQEISDIEEARTKLKYNYHKAADPRCAHVLASSDRLHAAFIPLPLRRRGWRHPGMLRFPTPVRFATPVIFQCVTLLWVFPQKCSARTKSGRFSWIPSNLINLD